MIEITREMIGDLYNKQKNTVTSLVVGSLLMWIVGAVCMMIASRSYDTGMSNTLTLIGVILIAIPFVLVALAKKKLIPQGNGKLVSEAMNVLHSDFMSDATVNNMLDKIGRAENFADKVSLIVLLCNVYQFRGQYHEALKMLDTVDRSRFIEYPDAGMTYYNAVTDIYTELEDSGSVLAAYADAEAFIDECAKRNYSSCNTALSIMIRVEKARGNYRKALDMKLMSNEYQNQLNSFLNDVNKEDNAAKLANPLTSVVTGSVFYETAELFYLNGDLVSASKYLNIGGPMLAPCQTALDRANRLSEKVREKMQEAK